MDYTDSMMQESPSRNLATYSLATGQFAVHAGLSKVVHTASIQATQSNRGELHEVSFFIRLVSFTV